MASVFEKFGGIRPMASKLDGIPPSTVMSWQRKGKIPTWRHQSILAAAMQYGIALTSDELKNICKGDPASRRNGETREASA